jgi:hypothetical protein
VYTSCLRNLLQRHFKKVTHGEWFASGAIVVPMADANSVERTWGRGSRIPHPKWETVAWEVVRPPYNGAPIVQIAVLVLCAARSWCNGVGAITHHVLGALR